MASDLVCLTCGLAVTPWLDSYKHASGGRNGVTPKHRQHRPVPVPRADYERAYALDTPPAEARDILARLRDQSRREGS